MALHRRNHPQPVDGCFGCKAMSLQMSGGEQSPQSAMEARWQKDMPAFKSLVDQGFNPLRIDGSAELVARSATRFEIESGTAVADTKGLNEAIRIVEDATGHSVFEAQATPIVQAAG